MSIKMKLLLLYKGVKDINYETLSLSMFMRKQ